MTKIAAMMVLLLVSIQALATEHTFWQTHTLVMIYASTCPHCHHQAEVLAPLLASKTIPYQLYSLDNQPLPQFKSFSPLPSGLLPVAFPDGKVSYPAFFIVTNQTLALYPVSYGFLEANELVHRLWGLREKISHYEANIYAS